MSPFLPSLLLLASPPPPTGATIEPSGFATILEARPEPYPEAAPAAPRRGSEAERLAREAGISVAEAEARMNPDAATMRAAMKLRRRLERDARGNYVDVRIVRDPLPRYVFHFRRNAAATLARFTSDKRFAAVEGGVPAARLDPLFEKWLMRFAKYRLVSAASIDPFAGEVQILLGVGRNEFEAIAAKEGWTLPGQVRLRYAREIDPAEIVAPDALPFVRVFPRAERAPGAVAEVAKGGRIVLRDGCFRLDDGKGGGPLVLFGRNTGLRRDAQGYLVVASLDNPGARARIGEAMVWGGYLPAVEEEAGVQALRRQCGAGPIESVGEPTSARLFRIRPWAIDGYAAAKGLPRQRAWEEIKACWTEQEHRLARPGRLPGAPRDCDVPGPPDVR